MLMLGLAAAMVGAPANPASPQSPKHGAPLVVGEWNVRVDPGEYRVGGRRVRVARAAVLDVPPAVLVRVRGERYDALPLYNPQAAPWARGARLRGVITSETTAPDLLAPESVTLRTAAGAELRAGTDYEIDRQWGTFGRLAGGSLAESEAVLADYDHGLNRIDRIVVGRDGTPRLLVGAPHNATPHPPTPGPGERVIANVWVPGRLARLADENLYAILEPVYPAPRLRAAPAASLLPTTWEKLNRGATVNVLAWGDSVTAGGEASDVEHRYQNRFVALLRERFPKADIRLTTAGWGGRNSDSFLAEPPGAEFNFDHAVIDRRPDLIVMEFVNDAFMTPEVVESKYSYLLERFRQIGAEWVIITPHYVWPAWMGSSTVRVETDPRPYVAGLRAFAARHHVALADASLRWGHLVKEGIPYVTLLVNSLNHPDDRGHEMFARSLMELFGGR